MLKNPLVSIIVPVYNSAKYIQETIDNLLAQTWANKEIICVDDGSTDSSKDIILTYIDNYKEIALLSQSNSGAPAARNHGLKYAKGDYIQFIDADDLMDEDKIEKQLFYSNFTEDGIVTCDWARFDENSNINNIELKYNFCDLKLTEYTPLEWLYLNKMAPVHSWLTPRKIIDKVGPWEEDLFINQDGEYFFRVVGNCSKVIINKNVAVYYRSSINGSISSKSKEHKAVISKLKTLKILEYTVLSIENTTRSRRFLANRYQRFIYNNYPVNKKLLPEVEEKIKELGGSDYKMNWEGLTKKIVSLFGWKMTSRIKNIFDGRVFY